MALDRKRVEDLRARLSDDGGSTLPMFAFTLMALVALAFAAIALGLDSKAANNLQNAADSAALAGATAFVAANSPRAEDRLAEAQASAHATAAGNAEFALTNFDVSAVTEDPYGQHTEIEVSLAFQPANVAASVLGRNANIALTRTALASATWGFPLCVLALEPSKTGVATAGNTSLSAKNCVVWSNSTGTKSMNFSGGDAETKFFCAAGKASVTGGTQISPRPTEHCDQIPDPLADWPIPAAGTPDVVATLTATSRDPEKLLKALEKVLNDPDLKNAFQDIADAIKLNQPLPDTAVDLIASSLDAALAASSKAAKLLDENGVFLSGDAQGLSVFEVAQILGIVDNVDPTGYTSDTYSTSPTLVLSPGTYAGLDISKGNVRLAPGVYHIVDAPLIVRRKATLTGDGVTIVLHGEKATFSVADQARLTLTAPVDGDTAGFALVSDPHSIPHGKIPRSRLTGSGRVSMIGTVYLPEQELAITGKGAADQSSPMLQIVANSIDMSGQGGLRIDFDETETNVPMKIKPAREARLLR
ncbi:MAG TPA: pilus assembly protein TadG-related protein [Hyphomonas sp.]|nr:pilus assembly protein TadG-related protein [Hyphomonas sp.]